MEETEKDTRNVKMRLGIYGGTFDPPHKGHIEAAKAALKALSLDKLLLIPTAAPPHKELPDNSPSGTERLEMTRLAVSGMEKTETSDIEIARGGRSYTADTLEELKKQYPEADMFLLMGTDMLLSFEMWKSFETILQTVTLAVFTRADGEAGELERFSEYLRSKYDAKIILIPHDNLTISSSEIRNRLPERAGREYLDEKVYEYIVHSRFYGVRPDFEWMRQKAYSMLKPRRVPHVKGCEQEAVKLAERWGEDTDKAREAAILHDITKKEELEQQLILCEKYGIITDTVERANFKLLHSKTGAAAARDIFGSDDDICSAILWHTTGRENMTLLEKIIYLADYIEPTRDFDGLSELRRLAYEDIDSAMLLGLEMSIEDMRQNGIEPHYRSADAARWFKKEQKI